MILLIYITPFPLIQGYRQVLTYENAWVSNVDIHGIQSTTNQLNDTEISYMTMDV